jgi:hypothetical protein
MQIIEPMVVKKRQGPGRPMKLDIRSSGECDIVHAADGLCVGVLAERVPKRQQRILPLSEVVPGRDPGNH